MKYLKPPLPLLPPSLYPFILLYSLSSEFYFILVYSTWSPFSYTLHYHIIPYHIQLLPVILLCCPTLPYVTHPMIFYD